MSPADAFRFGMMAMLFFLTTSSSVQAQSASEMSSRRGYLGVFVSPDSGKEKGVLVRQVTPDSPADKAGLKTGDRVVKLNNEDVQDVEKFMQAVAAMKAGGKLSLQVIRDGKEQNLNVTLGERPSPEMPSVPSMPGFRRPAFLGVQTQPLTPEMKKQFNVESDSGAVVTEVVPNSPAAKAGLKRDDVITAVDDQQVRTPADLREAVQKVGSGKEATLQVMRGKEKLSIKANLREGNFGSFITPGEDRFPSVDVGSMIDQGRRIRELEKRIDELEKRIQELEKKK